MNLHYLRENLHNYIENFTQLQSKLTLLQSEFIYYRVIDGVNVTVSDEHMWLIPFNEGQNHTITINFGQKVYMAGLRLWNYNKSKEDTYRGVSGCSLLFQYWHLVVLARFFFI